MKTPISLILYIIEYQTAIYIYIYLFIWCTCVSDIYIYIIYMCDIPASAKRRPSPRRVPIPSTLRAACGCKASRWRVARRALVVIREKLDTSFAMPVFSKAAGPGAVAASVGGGRSRNGCPLMSFRMWHRVWGSRWTTLAPLAGLLMSMRPARNTQMWNSFWPGKARTMALWKSWWKERESRHTSRAKLLI